jgi:hypothetical protein
MEAGAGFVVGGIEEAARAIESLASFDRRQCREVFERRFTSSRMATDYVNIYEQLLKKGSVVEFGVTENFLDQKLIKHPIRQEITLSS